MRIVATFLYGLWVIGNGPNLQGDTFQAVDERTPFTVSPVDLMRDGDYGKNRTLVILDLR